MNNNSNSKWAKYRAFTAGVLLALPPFAVAEDIEVYTGRDHSAGVRPNVVFIFDTSREMTYGPNRILLHETYDAEFAYPGNCERDKVYMTPASRKDEFFSNSYRWDGEKDAAGFENDGCTYVPNLDSYEEGGAGYPFYRVQLREQDTRPGSPWIGTGLHAGVDDVRCVAARNPLKTAGFYRDRFRWRKHESWNGGWKYYPGLNFEVAGEKPDYWMQNFYCAGDGVLGGETAEFYLFTGNYLNWYFNYRKTRLEIAKEGIEKALDSIPGGVNVGLMTLTENTLGARVLAVPKDLGVSKPEILAALEEVKGALDERGDIVGMSAFAGSMFEAYNYFAGEKAIPSDWNGDGGGFYSVPESLQGDGETFNSPIDLSCQSNHVVLVTDGDDSDENAGTDDFRTFLNGMPGFIAAEGGCDGNLGGDCAVKIARFMQKHDVNRDVPDVQTVTTHAIGIGVEGTERFFSDLTAAGGGTYVLSRDADQLKDAIRNMFETDIVINGTFVAPAVSVNAFNRSQHRNELFFAVFKVGENFRWTGNLKKYQLMQATDGSVFIADVNGNPALDATTGEFAETSRSWWSSAVDGNDPVAGGANARLQQWADNNVNRSLWTDVVSGVDIITGDNRLTPDNGHITNAYTNAPDDATRVDWLTKLRSGELRTTYGDPLHSRPVVINYGGTDTNPDAVAYFTTNDGFLHAVRPGNATTADAAGGYELWAYMPKEMLKNLGKLVSTGVQAKGYGLDSAPMSWVKDDGAAGVINPSSPDNDHVYLYFGAGRGGRLYYGVDVTKYAYPYPKKLWTAPIQGGLAGADADSSGPDDEFNELGYTMAEPVRGHIKIGSGSGREVLVLSGGYDPDYDLLPGDTETDSGEDMGRAIYIVDAKTGARLWTGAGAGTSDKTFDDMDYPIVSSVRLLDMNNDGFSDRMYVGDLGGQLWRFDINNGQSASNLVDGGVIAKLGTGLATDTRTRRFFNTPDAVLVNNRGGAPYLAINIGSGNRSRPVADMETQDIFFSIRDKNVYNTPTSYDYGIDLGDTELVDITGIVNPALPANATGWYLKLRPEEKVLAESRTFEHQLIFTSYQPDDEIATTSCMPNLGIGRVYTVDVRNAKPVLDIDGDGVTETDDRGQELDRQGIPPEPVILFPEVKDGEPTVCVGPECDKVKPGHTRFRTYWTDELSEQ